MQTPPPTFNLRHAALHLALTLGIYLGVPLLGWGLTDLRAFIASPGRAGFVLFTLVGAGLAAYQGLRLPETRGLPAQRVTRQTLFLIVFAVAGVGLLFALPFLDRRGLAVMDDNPGLRIWGVVWLAQGGTLMFGSVLNLGRLYSPEVTLQPGHHLVTTGWYQYIRHPRYLGLIIMILGFGLVFRSWAGLAATGLAVAALAWRISDEERLLAREFGAQWEAYCRRTWRLIPRLW